MPAQSLRRSRRSTRAWQRMSRPLPIIAVVHPRMHLGGGGASAVSADGAAGEPQPAGRGGHWRRRRERRRRRQPRAPDPEGHCPGSSRRSTRGGPSSRGGAADSVDGRDRPRRLLRLQPLYMAPAAGGAGSPAASNRRRSGKCSGADAARGGGLRRRCRSCRTFWAQADDGVVHPGGGRALWPVQPHVLGRVAQPPQERRERDQAVQPQRHERVAAAAPPRRRRRRRPARPRRAGARPARRALRAVRLPRRPPPLRPRRLRRARRAQPRRRDGRDARARGRARLSAVPLWR